MSQTRRLDVLAKRYPRQPERPPALDLAALTQAEQVELLVIVGKLESAPKHANGRPDLAVLTDAEVERLGALAVRITETQTP